MSDSGPSLVRPLGQFSINTGSGFGYDEGVVMHALEFSTAGSPRAVARAIEDFARAQAHVAAIVVPWESDATALNMAVTAVTGEGWAIEHTNLGTITLTDRGSDVTAVAVSAAGRAGDETPELAALFERFTRLLQRQFSAAS